MIAKIVTHGATRAIALRALESALEDTEVAGSVTNVDFLIALTRHAGFQRGQVDTGLIARDADALVAASEPSQRTRRWRCWASPGWTIRRPGAASPCGSRCAAIAWQGGEAVLEVLGPGAARVTLDGRAHQIGHEGGRWWVDGNPRRWRIVNHAAGTSVFGGRAPTSTRSIRWTGRGRNRGRADLSRYRGWSRPVFVVAGQPVAAGDRQRSWRP